MLAANLQPYFVDVDFETWQANPETMRERPDLTNVGAVVVASPFGSPVDTHAWDEFSAATGIPVVIDAAAAFDTVASVARAAPRRSPLMISLNATKCFGIGEGGLVLSRNDATIDLVREACNFGMLGSPESRVLATTAK